MLQRQHMQPQMQNPMTGQQMSNQIPSQLPQQSTHQYKPQLNQQLQPQQQPQLNQGEANKIMIQPFIQPPAMMNQFSYPYIRPQMMFPYQIPKPQVNPPAQLTSTTTTTLTEVKDMLQEALKSIKTENSNNSKSDKESDISSIKGEAELDFEKEYSLEEENLKNIWSGYLTKNKRDRIIVDAYQIRGNISEHFTESQLNVSHRTQYDEIMKRPILGIIAISPENVTQCDLFQDYINYFNEKQRVGVINTESKSTLYLVPPCEFSRKFYQNPKKHLLGILVDSTKEPKSYVDMNNLSLPPSVISTTEKKLLAKQQKKNTQSSNQQNNPQGTVNNLNLSELGFDQTLLNQLKELDSNKMTIKERTDFINSNPKLKALLSNISNQTINQQNE